MNNFWTTHIETTILWFIFSSSSTHSFLILLFYARDCTINNWITWRVVLLWVVGLGRGNVRLVIKLLAIPGGTPISSVIGSFAESQWVTLRNCGLQTALLLMESLWNRVDPRKQTTFLLIALSWVLLTDSCKVHYPDDYLNQVFRAGKFPGEPLYGNTLKALIGGMYICLVLNYDHLPPFLFFMEPPFETEMWRHGLSVGLHSFHSAFCCQLFTR